MGRFTAPDPARDMRGDGDLYDYCVDDPVSCVDPAGLATVNPQMASIAKDEFATDIAWLGLTIAGHMADGAEWLFTGKTDHKASQGAQEAIKLLRRKDEIMMDTLKKTAKEIAPDLTQPPQKKKNP